MKVTRRVIPAKAEIETIPTPDTTIELSVSISIGRRNSAGDFRNITIRSGETRECSIDEITHAHDAAWKSVRSQLRERFPQVVKIATEMEDE